MLTELDRGRGRSGFMRGGSETPVKDYSEINPPLNFLPFRGILTMQTRLSAR